MSWRNELQAIYIYFIQGVLSGRVIKEAAQEVRYTVRQKAYIYISIGESDSYIEEGCVVCWVCLLKGDDWNNVHIVPIDG